MVHAPIPDAKNTLTMRYIQTPFSTEMVIAMNLGIKEMTRRTKGLDKINENPDDWILTTRTKSICRLFVGKNPNPIKTYFIFENKYTKEQIEIACPYGETRDEKDLSDVLWVRETFLWVMLDHAPDLLEGARNRNQYVYKASVHQDWIDYAKEKYGYKWTPSIFMPKAACRIFLRVTARRAERLKDISRGDAMSEGCPFPNMAKGPNPIEWFFNLWTSINGKDSLEKNPWVWVISFERIEKPENFC